MVSLSRSWPRVTVVTAAILVPIAVLAVVGMVLLWPSGARSAAQQGAAIVGTDYPSARVIASAMGTCQATEENRLPDGTVPATADCLSVRATVTSGAHAGSIVNVYATPPLQVTDVPVGTAITLEHFPAAPGAPETWTWHDFARTTPLLTLAAIFALVTIAVAQMRGLRALIGLTIAFTVIAAFLLPALLAGKNPVIVGLVASSLIMFVVLYLAHGLTLQTSSALLGTLAGLGVTAALGVAAASAAHINGAVSEDSNRLASLLGQTGSTGLRGIFLCGVVLAGLGVLNDVTVTQSSAVWELRSADPTATRNDLFTRAMRIGRDHIASTIYTIAFAYAGASLPVLLLVEVYQLPLIETLTSAEFAGEIVRTLVGSIGLVLAIPLTTAIAALMATAGPATPLRRRHRQAAVLAHQH
ncbi:MAG TPA: YibE/F family protein [Pseudonocardiaceae bacterium]